MKFDVKRVKIAVTIPVAHVNDVREAVCNAGAGIFGAYSFCTSSTSVIGTFIPNEYANPYIGQKDKLEFVEEEKLEVVCDVNKVKEVLLKLREVHPYEEPAIDIIPLIDETYFSN